MNTEELHKQYTQLLRGAAAVFASGGEGNA